LELDPNQKRALNQMGYLYTDKKNYAKALEYFQKYVDVAPNEATPYNSMGNLYLLTNDYKKSITMFEKASQIKPDFGSQAGIVENYIKMHDYQKARNVLNQWGATIGSDRWQIMIYNYYAISYIAEGDLENSISELEKRGNFARQIADTTSVLWNQLDLFGILLENDMIKKAEEKLEEFRKLMENPESSAGFKKEFGLRYINRLTRLAAKKGDIDQAKKYAEQYKQELEKKMGSMNWYYGLVVLIDYAEGNYKKVITDILRYDLDTPDYHYYLGLAYLKSGDKNKAIEYLERVINYTDFPNLSNEMYRNFAEKQLALLKDKN